MTFLAVVVAVALGLGAALFPAVVGSLRSVKEMNLSVQASIAALALSFALMALSLFVCAKVARQCLVAYACGLIPSFLVASVVWAVRDVIKQRR